MVDSSWKGSPRSQAFFCEFLRDLQRNFKLKKSTVYRKGSYENWVR